MAKRIHRGDRAPIYTSTTQLLCQAAGASSSASGQGKTAPEAKSQKTSTFQPVNSQRAPTPSSLALIQCTTQAELRDALIKKGLESEMAKKVLSGLSLDGIFDVRPRTLHTTCTPLLSLCPAFSSLPFPILCPQVASLLMASKTLQLNQATFPKTFAAIDAAADDSFVKRALALSGIQGLFGNEADPLATTATAIADSPQKQLTQQQMLAIMATKAALEPFLKEAVEAEEKEAREVNEARKKTVEEARAKLLQVNIKLPSGVDVSHLTNYLATQMQELSIKQAVKPDLDAKSLVDRLGLMRCVRLRPGGADIVSGNVGRLKRGKDPFKQPLGVSFAYEDREIVENSRHAETTKLESTVGASLAASTSSKGAGFYGGAVGAWSASMSAEAAVESKSASAREKSGSSSTQVKTTEVILKSSQFSLAESDFDLTPEFEHSLRRLLRVLKVDPSDDGERAKLIANESGKIFEEFGTHLATQALIGGRFSIKCTITVEKTAGVVTDQKALAAALSFRASAGIVAACPAGGGTASAAMEATANANISNSDQTNHHKYLSHTQTSQYVTGGASGNLNSWLTSMASNHSWEVLDREANNGFRCATAPGHPPSPYTPIRPKL